MEEKTLASELLHELKSSARRWFIAFCIMIALEILTIAGFLWYVSLPVEMENIEMEADDGGNVNYLDNSAIEGDINNGTN